METLALETITIESDEYRTESQYEVGSGGNVHILSQEEADRAEDAVESVEADGESVEIGEVGETEAHIYAVEEPELSEIERFALREAEQAIRDEFQRDSWSEYEPEELQVVCEAIARKYLTSTRLNISHLKDSVFGEESSSPTMLILGDGSRPPSGAPSAKQVTKDVRENIAYHVRKRTGFHELNTPIRDKHITEIRLDGLDENVRVVHTEYGEMETNISFTQDTFRRLTRTLDTDFQFEDDDGESDEEDEDTEEVTVIGEQEEDEYEDGVEYEFETERTEGTFSFNPVSLELSMLPC